MMFRPCAILSVMMLVLFLAQPSLAQETSGVLTGGSVGIGYDSRACSGSLSGSLRYSSASSCLEYCDGTDWVCPSAEPCVEPALCPNIGDVCDDGNAGTTNDPIFAGFMVYNDGNSADESKCAPLYVANQNQSTAAAWKTSTGADDIASDSMDDGLVNDGQVADSATFPAFKACKDLTDGGFTNWYLPSRAEIFMLWQHKVAIDANAAGALTTTDNYWVSMENDTTTAYNHSFTDGQQGYNTKTSNNQVRCVRRD